MRYINSNETIVRDICLSFARVEIIDTNPDAYSLDEIPALAAYLYANFVEFSKALCDSDDHEALADLFNTYRQTSLR